MIDHHSYAHNLSSCKIKAVMINHVFICFSTVQIYDLPYVLLHYSPSTSILQTRNVTISHLA